MFDEIRIDNRDPLQVRISILSGRKWKQKVFPKPISISDAMLEGVTAKDVAEWNTVKLTDLSTTNADC